MAKAVPFAPKPALEKLPLAVRKDIRDKYEAEKEDLESKISELLGTPFHININANEVWAYYDPSSGYNAGSVFKGYVDGFIYALGYFLENYGDEGKTHFNEAVTQSELQLGVNELGDKATAINAEIKDGVFRILFNHKNLNYNLNSLGDYLLAAVEAVPREGFNLIAKKSIEDDWTDKIDELTATVVEALAMPDLVLDPNFEENYAALTAGRKDKDWYANFGRATFGYFDGVRKNVDYQGFKGDEMLQEGLAEVLESKTIKLRIVDKTNKTVETVLEGGVIYIQMTASNWYYNLGDAGEGLVNLL